MTIRLRVSLGFAAAFCLALVLLGSTIYVVLAGALRDEIDKELQERAAQLERASVLRGNQNLDARGLSADIFVLTPGAAQELEAPGIFARVVNPSGVTLALSSGVAARVPVEQGAVTSAAGGRAAYATTTVDGAPVRVLYAPLNVNGTVRAVVQVGESLRPMERTLARTKRLLLLAGMVALAGGLVGGWLVTRQALKPVGRLTNAVARIAATGKFDQRAPAGTANDEVGRLAATFNALLERITQLVDRQRALVADTSHELRNPLMVARGNLELLAHDLPADARRLAARDAIEEVDRMTRLVADLLFLADADTDKSIAHEAIDLDDIMSEAYLDAVRISVREDGMREVKLERNDEVTVRGDAERLRQLIRNLVENAIRYTPADGTVSLALRRHGPVAEITVADTGIGIAPEHLPHIFERFYRVDRGRSRALGGTGLGLSIVRQVAEAHGGQVRVRSVPGEGTTFTVALPVAVETPNRSAEVA